MILNITFHNGDSMWTTVLAATFDASGVNYTVAEPESESYKCSTEYGDPRKRYHAVRAVLYDSVPDKILELRSWEDDERVDRATETG